jgi:hypothetical protein
VAGLFAGDECEQPTAIIPARSAATARALMVCRRETLIFIRRLSSG